MYKDDEDDDGVRESTMLSRRRRKRKKVRTEVTTLRPRSSKNKPHLMSNCVRKRMGRYTTINDLKVTVSSLWNIWNIWLHYQYSLRYHHQSSSSLLQISSGLADADGMPVFEHFPKRNIANDRDEADYEARSLMSSFEI